MRIDSLAVTNFRNLRSARISFGEGTNIFYGDNGSGKTNLLEAIFTLCLGRSQRGARDAMMVGEGEDDFFRLEGIGEVEKREVKLACAYQINGRKKITIDNSPARTSKLFQIYSVISMAPDDVALFTGSPSERRHFLDLHLSQASPSYLADLGDYNRALAQKNSFLKNFPGEMCPFDPLLVQYGSRITAARQNFVHFLQALAPGYYHQIADGQVAVARLAFVFAYKPSIPFINKDEIAINFESKLASYRSREKVLETALVGPHRDDIEFFVGGFPARGYGSQGELRSAAIAVMMAAANFLESRRREKPIFLLDEIFAELDDKHRQNLAELFARFEQIFLTTAVEPPSMLTEKARVYYLQHGEVTEK